MSLVALAPAVYVVARDCDTCDATHVARVDVTHVGQLLHTHQTLPPTAAVGTLAEIGAALDRAADGWSLRGTGGRCAACVGGVS